MEQKPTKVSHYYLNARDTGPRAMTGKRQSVQ